MAKTEIYSGFTKVEEALRAQPVGLYIVFRTAKRT